MSRLTRKATRKLERWRAKYAPTPVGKGARKRCRALRQARIKRAAGTLSALGAASALMRQVENPPPDANGVRSARSMRNALTSDGENLRGRLEILAAGQRAAHKRLQAARDSSWRDYYTAVSRSLGGA